MIWPFSTISNLRYQLSEIRLVLLEADARSTRRLNEIAMLQRALEEAEKPLATATTVAVGTTGSATNTKWPPAATYVKTPKAKTPNAKTAKALDAAVAGKTTTVGSVSDVAVGNGKSATAKKGKAVG